LYNNEQVSNQVKYILFSMLVNWFTVRLSQQLKQTNKPAVTKHQCSYTLWMQRKSQAHLIVNCNHFTGH